MKVLLLAITTGLLQIIGCFSRPFGAGSCAPGNAAIQAGHGGFGRGTLWQGGYVVKINGMELTSTKMELMEGEPHLIEIMGTTKDFKGFLLRFDGGMIGDTRTIASSTSGDVQISDICTVEQRVGGLTHTINTLKSVINGTIMAEVPPFIFDTYDVTVDVTVVTQYTEWYFSSYRIGFLLAPSENPSKAPSSIPTTAAPSATMSTRMPTTSPTSVPTSDSTSFPTFIPIDCRGFFRCLVSFLISFFSSLFP